MSTQDGSGRAHVYKRSGTVWTLQSTLVPSDSAADDAFGYSVALDGDTAIVSAVYDDGPMGPDEGSVYAFTRSGTTWTQTAKIVRPAGAYHAFGHDVSLSGDTAIIGSFYTASVFVRSGSIWSQQAQLAGGNSDVAYVELHGETAIIGDSFSPPKVYSRAGAMWSLRGSLSVAGAATAFTGATAFVCRPDDAVGGNVSQGSVWATDLGCILYDPPCLVDYDGNGLLQIVDIFAMLAGWFAMDPPADWNNDSLFTISDVFAFLASWFAGCP